MILGVGALASPRRSSAPEQERRDRHVIVAGGGVAGLMMAWRLLADPELAGATPTAEADPRLGEESLAKLRARLRVTVVESQPRLGGNIRSQRDRGFLVEWGPNGYLNNAPETPRLARLLGIENRILPARDAAARRFLYVRGMLRPLPLSPVSFLLSDVLSLRGRLRVLMEPFIAAHPDPEESVFDFAARRIGREAARTLVDAMTSGVYGGDARRLSVVGAFPKLYNLEKEYGGLVRGMIARRKEAKKTPGSGGPVGPGGVLTSYDEGMTVLIDTLAAALRSHEGCEILQGTPATALAPGSANADGRWRVNLEDGRVLVADAVVLAVPSLHAGALVRPFDPSLCTTLQSIPEAPLVVVGLAYALSDFPAPLEGFGFLIPRGEGPRCLGVLWDSCIYANRAPEGTVLLRAMLGGVHDPEAIGLTDDEILAQVKADLSRTMDLVATPSIVWILRHRHGIPQYTLGHPRRLQSIEEHRARWPGLHLTGNSYRGISVNHCVEQSIPLARDLLVQIGERP